MFKNGGIFHCYVRLPECISFVSQFLFRPPFFFFTAFSVFQVWESPSLSVRLCFIIRLGGEENLCSCKACIAIYSALFRAGVRKEALVD